MASIAWHGGREDGIALRVTTVEALQQRKAPQPINIEQPNFGRT